jgi:hypothetical protein
MRKTEHYFEELRRLGRHRCTWKESTQVGYLLESVMNLSGSGD